MKTYAPTFINAQNPELTLLAYFLAMMAMTNEEATFRVFEKLSITCKEGHIYVRGPTNQIDIVVAPES